MPWKQLTALCERRHSEQIEDCLLDCGATSITLEDGADQPILEPGVGETPLWDTVRVRALFEAGCEQTQIECALSQCDVSLAQETARWELVEDKDWSREWQQHFVPTPIGKRLWIVPSWTPAPDPDAVNLQLDPGLAFGTGTHPTTRLCLQWLDRQQLDGKAIVDYGCGSGILAIAALLLGARCATCTDIDPQALQATRENAKRNDIPEERLHLCTPEELVPGSKADVVVANILAEPLIELAPALSDLLLPEGWLCLSGILASQALEVQSTYVQSIRFQLPVIEDGWAQLAGQRMRN